MPRDRRSTNFKTQFVGPSLSLSGLSSDTDDENDSDGWSSILGVDWRSASSISTQPTAASSAGSTSDDSIPELLSLRRHNDSGSDTDSLWGDDEFSEDDSALGSEVGGSDESDDETTAPKIRTWIQQEIQSMYEQRYEEPRTRLPKPAESYLFHVLTRLKTHPEYFRLELRISPYTFDKLVAEISQDPVFSNNSETAPQTPVEEQLAVALYRFGHDGNASGLQSTANWAGVGKGTVHLFTRRILTAILRPGFMQKEVRFPTDEEKEEAKKWVAKHSCKAWRNGWCFVDGTLIPLARRPYWFGESYFDRKCRYSLNFQVSFLMTIDDIY